MGYRLALEELADLGGTSQFAGGRGHSKAPGQADGQAQGPPVWWMLRGNQDSLTSWLLVVTESPGGMGLGGTGTGLRDPALSVDRPPGL